jgi:hypothetical protein
LLIGNAALKTTAESDKRPSRFSEASIGLFMKTPKEGVAIWRLDENRYAVGINHLIRYVGSL